MMLHGTSVILLLLAVPAPSDAHARPPRTAPRSVEARVEGAIRAELPRDLALGELILPAAMTAREDLADVTVRWRHAPRDGRNVVALEAETPQGRRTFYARARLDPISRVSLATRDLAAGEALDETAWIEALLPLPAGGARPAQGLGRGTRLLRAVKRGEMLSEGAVAPEIPVARGSRVWVVSRAGAASVGVEGTLERAARTGQPTLARIASGRTVRGRLVDRGTLYVEEGQP
ncbi:MAG: flagella basal body P-ring formation protein FlgA [Deltaproteobacteria bacterium]|nr:flagella basal body P-ring formation protein FlgA [Deltaproteobacteria bacterium]